MLKRFTVTLLIFTIILSFIQFYGEEGNASAIKDFSFKQEINIPIDTSLEMAKFQPVDMRINFENPCWAKNETVRSVRVYYDNGYGFTEIESQIYDLDFIDDAHIRACSLVFLIPPEANGKEKYYVLYDESETPPPQYTDHVSIEDTHYFYEPISGQKIDFDYYKIIQDGYVIYGICQKGILLGNGVSHLVVKLKPNSTEFETVNADQFASFSMTYGTDDIKGEAGTDWATEISKNIIVDGNLMIRVRIKSISPERNLKTDNIYTYYYSPVAVKRLDANVNHEVLQTIEIKGNIERDGTYAHLSTFKSRSATIDKMNVGVILPSLHVYGEDSIIKEYSIPPDPSSEKEEWILSTRDDCDIGKKAWICLDDPATGKTHGFIFQSNTGFLKENDGLQVKTSVQQVVKLPGLEADAGSVFVARNTYEKGGKHDTTLPEGMNLTFNAEFITFEKGGYEAVDAESQIYQKMVPYKPILRGNVSHEEKEEKYNLTAYVHIAPSFPLGSALSAVLGKNFSYLYAEVYKENSLASSGSVSRLPLSEGMELEFENTTLIQKIKIILGLFDWKNFSLTKKIIFPGLDKGRYLLKVYKENPLFRKERQYIGFKAVDVENDVSTHIFCRPEGVAMFSIVNQNGEGIKDAKFFLIKDNITVAEEISDENGSVLLKAPYHSFSPYNLKIFYKGFLIEEKKVRLKLRDNLFSSEKKFNMSLYKLELRVKDTWGFAPSVDVSPTLTSNEMIEHVSLTAEIIRKGSYLFTNLYPSSYILRIGYKSFTVEKNVSIDENKIIEITFPAEFEISFNVMNSYGMHLKEGDISVARGNKILQIPIEKGNAKVFLPPGEYDLKIYLQNEEVAKQKINIHGNKEINIVTMHTSYFHEGIKYLGIIFAIFSIIFLIWKKKLYAGMKLLSFALVIISIVLPWWKLKGGNSMISTSTKVLLIPPKIVTLTSSPYVVGGEIGSVPLEVTLVLNLISFLLIIICLLIVISLLVKNKSRKTAIASSILSSLLLFVAICLFFYTMSQITKIGIGSFTGRGELEIALPGGGSELLFCKWGAGAGFYLSIMAFLCIISASIYGDINMACPTLKKFFKNLSSLFRKIFDRVKLFKANKKWIRAKLT